MTLDEFLAANPEPCGWPVPRTHTEPNPDGPAMIRALVAWEALGAQPVTPDEADAIAAMLICASRKAREIEAETTR